MANIEYKKIQTVLGNNWHVVVDDDWLFYPCGKDLDEVKKFVKIFEYEIVEKRYSEENYGLGFYICGYNGDAQNRLCDKWAERGVHVF
ncbi:hypothetical protein [Streptococcus thermophilus]|uniref:Uncharacterized protein n=2 Tax=root TaxID=1 RepID=W6LP65_9CAUD|nr:hypothetical protein [Streptococcus thermophilus]YP_009003351.1 hypothetical protein BW29_gp13 [Streptococcus phage 20617]MDA3672882.1 hypothetical protein [Streptococcus thermophilus]MDA5412782.1 hypothetical protein [Streptococcus thermophilus]TDG54769.1 hypothetical protein C4K59_000500 [Streptococcus thermophilus]UEC18267.1 hypothetical protein LK438_11110 [Streptococcus thermophilus LMD-9]UEC18308.1 hypothetical protein LK438_00110 [Streptococcus thermophilus LMD-9]